MTTEVEVDIDIDDIINELDSFSERERRALNNALNNQESDGAPIEPIELIDRCFQYYRQLDYTQVPECVRELLRELTGRIL